MFDCLLTGKTSCYKQANNVNSAFRPSGAGILSTGLLGWGEGEARSPPLAHSQCKSIFLTTTGA